MTERSNTIGSITYRGCRCAVTQHCVYSRAYCWETEPNVPDSHWGRECNKVSKILRNWARKRTNRAYTIETGHMGPCVADLHYLWISDFIDGRLELSFSTLMNEIVRLSLGPLLPSQCIELTFNPQCSRRTPDVTRTLVDIDASCDLWLVCILSIYVILSNLQARPSAQSTMIEVWVDRIDFESVCSGKSCKKLYLLNDLEI